MKIRVTHTEIFSDEALRALDMMCGDGSRGFVRQLLIDRGRFGVDALIAEGRAMIAELKKEEGNK